MRITNRMMTEQNIQRMEDALEKLSTLQTRVASGKKIQTAAEDPALAASALQLRSTLQQNELYLATSRVSGDWLTANELALKQMTDLATRASVLAQQGLSDTQGVNERLALGAEVDGLLRQAVQVGNTQHQGKHLFAGFKVNTQPFTYAGASVTSNLASTADAMQHNIAPGQTVTVNVDGNATFNPLFAVFIAVRDALLGNSPAALQTALVALNPAVTALNDTRTANGAKMRDIDTQRERLEQTNLALKKLLSEKEDISLAEGISQLKQQETVYQTVLNVSGRANLPTLFEFLR
jgi:flagellar hook-associated protein 3 FlgL